MTNSRRALEEKLRRVQWLLHELRPALESAMAALQGTDMKFTTTEDAIYERESRDIVRATTARKQRR